MKNEQNWVFVYAKVSHWFSHWFTREKGQPNQGSCFAFSVRFRCVDRFCWDGQAPKWTHICRTQNVRLLCNLPNTFEICPNFICYSDPNQYFAPISGALHLFCVCPFLSLSVCHALQWQTHTNCRVLLMLNQNINNIFVVWFVIRLSQPTRKKR